MFVLQIIRISIITLVIFIIIHRYFYCICSFDILWVQGPLGLPLSIGPDPLIFRPIIGPFQLFEGPSKALGLAQQACCPAEFPPGPCLVCRGASLHGFLVMQADAQTQQAPCLLRPCMNRPSPAPTPSFFFTPCVRSGDQHENCFPMHSAGSIYTTAQQAPFPCYRPSHPHLLAQSPVSPCKQPRLASLMALPRMRHTPLNFSR